VILIVHVLLLTKRRPEAVHGEGISTAGAGCSGGHFQPGTMPVLPFPPAPANHIHAYIPIPIPSPSKAVEPPTTISARLGPILGGLSKFSCLI